MSKSDFSGYRWGSAELTSSHNYLIPALLQEIELLGCGKLFQLGCGNDSVANVLSLFSCDVTGVDPSSEGFAQANLRYPNLRLFSGSAYDDLHNPYGQFGTVTTLEVVEHLYFPRKYTVTLFDLVESGDVAIVSMSYHGYTKNLAITLAGKMDARFTELRDDGHIKFWSINALRQLLLEAGFIDTHFR